MELELWLEKALKQCVNKVNVNKVNVQVDVNKVNVKVNVNKVNEKVNKLTSDLAETGKLKDGIMDDFNRLQTSVEQSSTE